MLIKEPPNRVIGLGYALDEFLIDPGRKGLRLSCAPKCLYAPCKLFLQKRSLPSIRIDAASSTYRLHGKDHKRSGQTNHPIRSRCLLTLKGPLENTSSELVIKKQNWSAPIQAESLFKEWQWLPEPLMKPNSGLKKDWQRRQR